MLAVVLLEFRVFSGSTIYTSILASLFFRRMPWPVVRPIVWTIVRLIMLICLLQALAMMVTLPAVTASADQSSTEVITQELLGVIDRRRALLEALESPTAKDYVEHCRFLSEIGYYDLPIYEVLEERSQACEEQLDQRFAGQPETLIFTLEKKWSDFDEHFDQIVATGLPEWNVANRQALFHMGAMRLDDESKAAAYALMLDDEHRDFHSYWKVLAYAKEHYPDEIPDKLLAELRSLATSQYDSDRYFTEFRHVDSQVQDEYMAKLGADDSALSDGIKLLLYASKNDHGSVNRLIEESENVFDIQATLGQLLKDPPENLGSTMRADLYASWSQQDWTRDPLLKVWYDLSKSSGHQLGLPPLKSIAIALGLCIALFFWPLLIVLPVHYIGLIRQQRHASFEPIFPGLTLRSFLIIAGGITLIDVFLSQYLADTNVIALLFDPYVVEEPAANLADLLVYGTLLQISLIFVVVNTRLWGLLWGTNRASAGKILKLSFFSVIACLIVSRIVNWWSPFGSIELGDVEDALSSTFAIGEYIQQLMRQQGLWVTLLIVALAGPMFEELLCRAIILNSTQRHLGFWAANIFQALVFMGLHLDTELYLYYFTFGIIAGAIYRSTRTLIAPILMHVTINTLAVTGLWLLMDHQELAPGVEATSVTAGSAAGGCLGFDASEPYAHFLDCWLASEQGDIRGTDKAAGFMLSEYMPANHNTRVLQMLLEHEATGSGNSYYLIHRIYLISEEHKDPLLSRKYLQKSADAGLPVAQSELASEILFTGSRPNEHDVREAIALLETAIQQGFLPARNQLAWFYATTGDWAYRDGVRAIELMEPLLPVEEMHYAWLDTLASAYAAAADFTTAVELQQQVVDRARQQQDESDLAGMEERLKLYQQRKGYFSDGF